MLVSSGTTTPRLSWQSVLYTKYAGSGIITSSPGFIRVSIVAEMASAAPTVTTIPSGPTFIPRADSQAAMASLSSRVPTLGG